MAKEEVSKMSLLNKQVVSSDGSISSGDGIEVDGKHEPRNSLSLCNKLCFAMGSMPFKITDTILGFFLQIYLLDVAELNPLYASIIVFVGRAWDAITDPTVGFLVSRSPWTRFGRMLPWIVLSTPFAVLAYSLVWYVPPFADHGKVVWYLVFYCLFETLQTCFHVPYSALTMFISPEQKDRDSCSAYRMTMEVLTMFIGTGIQGQIVGQASAPCIPVSNSTSIIAFNTKADSPVSLEDTKIAYMMASCAMSAIYIFCAIVLFFGVKERNESRRAQAEPMPFFQAIRRVMGYRPFVFLNMGVLLTAMAFYLLEGNFAVFTSYALGFRDDFQKILLVCMIAATLSVPFWHWVQTRFGKKTAFYAGNLCAVPFMILLVCVKSNKNLTYIFSFGTGVSVGAAILLPWSMLPDVIDDFEVHNPDSIGHEAIFYSLYVFLWKFCSGISVGISTLSLYFAGYITRGCTQPEEVHLTLQLLISAVPIAFIVVGLVIFYYYPVNEERRQVNRRLLQERRDSKPISKWTLEGIKEDSTEAELSNMV